MTPRDDIRTELLRDAHALLRLLSAATRAHMLDEHERLDTLLSQVSSPAIERVAEGLLREASLSPVAGSPARQPSGEASRTSTGEVVGKESPLDHELAEVVALRSRP